MFSTDNKHSPKYLPIKGIWGRNTRFLQERCKPSTVMVVFTRSNPSLLKQIQLVRALHPGAEDANASQGTTHSFGTL